MHCYRDAWRRLAVLAEHDTEEHSRRSAPGRLKIVLMVGNLVHTFSAFLTRQQVREVDRRAIEELGVPSIVLMENAGRGAAELLQKLGIHGPVAICCGKGNNGGDGFVIARHLHNVGVKVRVLLFAKPDELSGDAAMNCRVIDRLKIPLTVIEQPDAQQLARQFGAVEWIVDALFGTGLSGPVRSPFDAVIRAINSAGVRVFAVDIPSGLDCDTGQPLGETVRATYTATFVAPKQAYANPDSLQWTGQVHVLDIGVPPEW
jgi:NAD(P)H-hydrate epimerase